MVDGFVFSAHPKSWKEKVFIGGISRMAIPGNKNMGTNKTPSKLTKLRRTEPFLAQFLNPKWVIRKDIIAYIEKILLLTIQSY